MGSENPYVTPKSLSQLRPTRKPSVLLWAMVTVFSSTIIGGLLGSLTGWAVGTFAPGYYRFVFGIDDSTPDFHPTEVGIGLGMTQGLGLGACVGVLIVGLFFWYRTRIAKLNAAEQKSKKQAPSR
ncbi:MAG: hypothetical protein AB8B55_03085 [Mariniblastus sp.]